MNPYSPPLLLLEIDELLESFGLFMLVLIGIELLETIVKTYLHQSTGTVWYDDMSLSRR